MEAGPKEIKEENTEVYREVGTVCLIRSQWGLCRHLKVASVEILVVGFSLVFIGIFP